MIEWVNERMIECQNECLMEYFFLISISEKVKSQILM